MKDRMLMYKKEEQIYGTQAKSGITDPDTGERKWQFYIWPMRSPEIVNEYRKETGFETTVEEQAEAMNINYKKFRLKDLKSTR